MPFVIFHGRIPPPRNTHNSICIFCVRLSNPSHCAYHILSEQTSYLVQFDPKVTYHNTLHVYTAVFLGQSLTMYLGGELEKVAGPRLTAYIGTIMISGGTYFSSNCTTLQSLIYCQAMAGIGIGLSYSAPILCGFRHFKQNKGIVTGVITTGTGFGPFLAGLIATSFVNSENYPVDSISGLYDPHASPVVSRVPSMFRILGIMYAVIGFVGASLLLDKSDDSEEPFEALLVSVENGEKASLSKHNAIGVYDMAMLEEESPSLTPNSESHLGKGRGHQRYGSRVKFEVTFELTTPQMIRDSLCWLVIAASICIGVTGLYVSATFKSFGQTAIADDHFITVVGCFGCLCSGLSRTFWGSTADKIGHFETLELSAYISPVIMLIYTLSVGSKLAFGVSVCALFWLWGASYCLMPAIVAFLL
jgi:OFA family oxalate/formate antiporter-like MFS transporter